MLRIMSKFWMVLQMVRRTMNFDICVLLHEIVSGTISIGMKLPKSRYYNRSRSL